MAVKVGTFVSPASATTLNVTGVGFTPKAILFFTSGGVSAGANASIFAQIAYVAGMAGQASVAAAVEDNVATSNTATAMGWGAAIYRPALNGGAINDQARVINVNSDGFDVRFETASALAMIYSYLAIGGDDVRAGVVNWLASGATGNQTVRGFGVGTPSIVFHLTRTSALTGALPQFGVNAFYGFGAMDASGNEWAIAAYSRENQAATEAKRYQVTNRCLATLTATGPAVSSDAAFSAMVMDGFTVNWQTAPSAGTNILSLAISGIEAEVGAFNKATGAATATQDVATDFDPLAVFLASVQATTSGSIQAHHRVGLGLSDGTNETSQCWSDTDAADPTQADGVITANKAFTKINSATPTAEAVCDVAMGTNKFTPSWTTNDAVATEILFAAFGAETSPGGGGGGNEVAYGFVG